MADFDTPISYNNSIPLAERNSYYQETNFCYIYKKYSGIKVRVTRAFINPVKPEETTGWAIMIEAANIAPGEDVNSRNPRLDWKNSIRMKLSMQEISNLAKYSEFAYIKALGSPIPMLDPKTGEIVKDNSGRPTYKVNKIGRPETVKEFIYHKPKEGDDTSFELSKSRKEYNGAMITMKKGGNTINIGLTMDELILFARCCKAAFDHMCNAAVADSEKFYQIWKSLKLKNGGSTGVSSSTSRNSGSGNSYNSGSSYSGNNNGPVSYRSYSSSSNSGPKPVSYEQLASGGDFGSEEGTDDPFGMPMPSSGDDLPF